jgi:predicted Zn-dependent protease
MKNYQKFCVAILGLALQGAAVAQDTGQQAINQANALLHTGKKKEAEAVLRAAVSANPNSAPLHGGLGQLLLKSGNYEDAVQELGQAAQQAPDTPAYSFLLSEALIGWKHYGVAVDFLNAVRAKFGSLAQFHYDLGLAYYDLNKMNESQSEFQEALRLQPDYERAQYMNAVCLVSLGDSTKSEGILRDLLKQHPDSTVYLMTLGEVLSPLGGENTAEAVRLLQHALLLSPHDSHIQFTAATVFIEAGDMARARPLLEHLERLDPKSLQVHVQLARLYARLGQRDLAKKENDIAIQLRQKNSANPDAAAGQSNVVSPQQ